MMGTLVSMAIAAALLLSMSRAAAARVPVAVAPDCNDTCGGVKVPYPFGMGPRHCYKQPGFKLTCDYGSKPPRLLLGDGAFEVAAIFLENNTMRVVSSHGINMTGATGQGRWSLGGDRVGAPPAPYVLLPDFNEFILTGCNVQATLVGNGSIVSGCASFCSATNDGSGATGIFGPDGGQICSSIGCCQSTIPMDFASYDVQLRRLGDCLLPKDKEDAVPVHVLVAETGWFSQELAMDLTDPQPRKPQLRVPAVLSWAVGYGDKPADLETRACPGDAAQSICRSTNSECRDEAYYTLRGYSCQCKDGYRGNPYLTAGCQRSDYVRPTGIIIGLSLAVTVPCLILLVLGAMLLSRKLKSRRAKRLKLKFFNQNRGQLLQQLVSHRSDIGDRMIIPLKELQKATNNFDQTRKLGGGGHGTVYKGILSDLHVVAIKKSNIVVQKEIDEFINEVAILSQINHRNVVKLHGCCLETEVPLLAYEFISNGTLADHLHLESPKSIPWEERLRIASEIAKAIAYLHSAVFVPVIHRDIKSSNVLLDDAFTAMVSDFGASRYISINQSGITQTAVQGTIGYLDPTYYYTGELSEKSDVYSFGVLLVELLTRKMPIMYRSSAGKGLAVQFVELLEQGNIVDILDSQVVEEGDSNVQEVSVLAASCINLRAEERPTMRQVEMALEGLRSTEGRVLTDLTSEKHVGPSYPSMSRRTNLEEVSRSYSLEEEFTLSARYPR